VHYKNSFCISFHIVGLLFEQLMRTYPMIPATFTKPHLMFVYTYLYI